MTGGVDWSVPRNKVAGATMFAGFILLSLSAYFGSSGTLEGTSLWVFRAICIAVIAYCVNALLPHNARRSAIVMVFLGFSAGVPILLIFGTLSLWLTEAGVEKSTVTMFSWAALGYSFKFVWAPLIDKLPVPLLTRLLGRRRGWILISQFAVIASMLFMALTDPVAGDNGLKMMAFAALALGFSSATQDIVIDAYRIERAPAEDQAMISSTYIVGYRIGMIIAGAGALHLATIFGSTKETYIYSAWMYTYIAMAAAMLIGVITTLVIREPENQRTDSYQYAASDYLRFLFIFFVAVLAFIATFTLSSGIVSSAKDYLKEVLNNRHLASFLVATVRLAVAATISWFVAIGMVRAGVGNQQMVREAYVEPVRDFFKRYGMGVALLLLALIGLYRVSDIVMGVIANVFYYEIGYTKPQIADVSKFFGLIMTIAGSLLGGFLAMSFGVIRILFLGAVLSAVTNLLFILLAQSEPSIPMLIMVIAADNLSAGLASAAFIAFLSSLTNISFTATQYAIFSSLMTLFPKILGGYSGSIAESIGYANFFTMTALLTLPVLLLIYLLRDRVNNTVVMRAA